MLFHYDESDSIYSITYYNGTSSSKYYLFKNLQGDVAEIRDNINNVVARYTYDAWGNPYIPLTNSGAEITDTTHFAYINPIRYRGYYYDSESGFYYLNSRYYDPANCRFVSADDTDFVDVTASPETTNLFAYCGNNPVARKDQDGQFWESVLDVVSLAASVVEVVKDPKDPMNWIGLVADTVDLVPFVTGVGEVTRAVTTTKKLAEVADDAHDAVQIAQAVDFTEEAADLVKTLDRSSGYTKSSASIGRKIHKGYKATKEFNLDWKEYKKIKGIRPDYVDFNTRTIYELKPMNLRGVKSGVKQLRKYNKALGGGFKMRLELY